MEFSMAEVSAQGLGVYIPSRLGHLPPEISETPGSGWVCNQLESVASQPHPGEAPRVPQTTGSPGFQVAPEKALSALGQQ